MKLLLENCRILARESTIYREIQNGCLGIENDTICYIGKSLPPDLGSYTARKDMSGRLLLPGLINCHCHAAMTLLRGIGSGLPLQNWLFDQIFPLEDRLEQIPNGIRIGAEMAMLEMLASGITSFTDMYMQPETTAEAVLSSGMKASLCGVVQSFDPEERYEDSARAKRSLALFDRYHKAGNGRLLIDFCIHAEYTCTDRIVRPYSEDCLQRGARMHLHLSETKSEHEACKERHNGLTPTEYFLSMGTLDSPTIAAHCVWAEPHDLEIFKEKGVFPVHNPTSNMKLGSGFAPIPEMLEKGIPVALGTDGAASNNNLNMLEEIHLASIIHCGQRLDPTAVLPEQILAMATANGARLQGRDDTGSLEFGKKADIIAIDLSKPHMQPSFDANSVLCYQAQAGDVCMTMVDGKILYENGCYYTMDAERIYSDYNRILNELHR